MSMRGRVQGGPIEPIQTLGFDSLDRPLTPNLGGVVKFSHGLYNAFVGQGQSQFEAPVKRPRR